MNSEHQPLNKFHLSHQRSSLHFMKTCKRKSRQSCRILMAVKMIMMSHLHCLTILLLQLFPNFRNLHFHPFSHSFFVQLPARLSIRSQFCSASVFDSGLPSRLEICQVLLRLHLRLRPYSFLYGLQ